MLVVGMLRVKTRVDAPIDPDLLDATGQSSKNAREGADRDALWWNAGDEDGVGLNGPGMDGVDEMVLALFQEMGHLLLDVIADPRYAKMVKMRVARHTLETHRPGCKQG